MKPWAVLLILGILMVVMGGWADFYAVEKGLGAFRSVVYQDSIQSQDDVQAQTEADDMFNNTGAR